MNKEERIEILKSLIKYKKNTSSFEWSFYRLHPAWKRDLESELLLEEAIEDAESWT